MVDNLPLELEFSISNNDKLDMNFVESSFDLMTNPIFSMAKRRDWMIPTPFVLTDAVVVKGKVKASPILEDNPKPLPTRVYRNIVIDSLKQAATD